MTLEVCVDNYESVMLAHKYGAKRVELCSALSVGGLSPSLTLARQCASLGQPEVHVMLRNREGNFVYTQEDLKIMIGDMELLSAIGIQGLVFGCLNENNRLDLEANSNLLNKARALNLEVSFHRAFDLVQDPIASLEQLIDLGFKRVLTSGQQARAIEGIELIADLVSQANGRIEIMAGSGVNIENAQSLSETGIDALHFSIRKKCINKSDLGMGTETIPDEEKIASISKLFS